VVQREGEFMIEVERISKSFGPVKVLHELSLRCGAGEVLSFTGPSGCGKTTLLRLIAGLDIPDSGRILLNGREASSDRVNVPPFQREVSFIFQDLALWPHMSVEEHLMFVITGEKTGKGAEQAAFWLDKTGLSGKERRYPHELSGGERQRLAIARALIKMPRFLLMDEPFSSLDQATRQKLWEIIFQVRDRKTAIINVTHDLHEAELFSDRVVCMEDGRV